MSEAVAVAEFKKTGEGLKCSLLWLGQCCIRVMLLKSNIHVRVADKQADETVFAWATTAKFSDLCQA
jgi:hypothetical protein